FAEERSTHPSGVRASQQTSKRPHAHRWGACYALLPRPRCKKRTDTPLVSIQNEMNETPAPGTNSTSVTVVGFLPQFRLLAITCRLLSTCSTTPTCPSPDAS